VFPVGEAPIVESIADFCFPRGALLTFDVTNRCRNNDRERK